MSTFSWIPRYSVSKTVAPRVRKTDFGGGYEQRSGDGLNTQRQEWTLEFVSDATTITNIENFLLETEGVTNFTWTPPRQTTPLKFIYVQYNRETLGVDTDLLSVDFKQVFDLV